MSKLYIFLATIVLVYLSTMTSQLVSASGDDDRIENHTEYRSSEGHHSEDEYEGKNNKKSIQLKNQEKLKKLQKKIKKIIASKPLVKTQTGTTTPIKTPIVTPITPPPTTTSPVQSTSVTKSSTMTYRTPDGSDPVLFTVTVKGGIITAASSTTKARNSTSIWYQDTFATKISGAVVGKKVAGLNLSAVGGASLTTTAFEQFVASSF